MRKLKVIKLNGCVKMERTNATFYRFKRVRHQLGQGKKYSLLASTKLWAMVAGHGQCEWSQGVRPSGLAFDISFARRTFIAFLVFNIQLVRIVGCVKAILDSPLSGI